MLELFVSLNFSDYPFWLLLLFVALGLFLLILGGQLLTDGAVSIANLFHISPLIVGLTVVSVATSMPELFTCLAAVKESPDLAIGNIIGSNIANIALILGVTAMIAPLASQPELRQRELPFLLFLTLLFTLLAYQGFARIEGLLLLGTCALYLIWIIKSSFQASLLARDQSIQTSDSAFRDNSFKAVFLVLSGALFLSLGADSLVEASQQLSLRLGVSEIFVGVSVIALGTSLPELAASVTAVLAKKNDLCIGNVVGSNLFNLSLIGGASASVHPFEVDPAFFKLEFPLLFGITVILFVFLSKARSIIGRKKAFVLLSIYFGAILLIALN